MKILFVSYKNSSTSIRDFRCKKGFQRFLQGLLLETIEKFFYFKIIISMEEFGTSHWIFTLLFVGVIIYYIYDHFSKAKKFRSDYFVGAVLRLEQGDESAYF